MVGGIATIFAVFVAIFAAFQFYVLRRSAKLPMHFGGHVKPGFEAVQTTFRENYEKGWDTEGSAFAAVHNDELIVDLWGGYANFDKKRTWNKDTMTTVFSTTKAVCAICLAMNVDRGLIDYDELVIKYWPEFGQNGKDNITVRMLASHQAGLVLLDETITYDLIRNWKEMSRVLENQKPNWTPTKTTSGYHLVTYGFLIDQMIRRVDPKGRSVGQFLRDEITSVYGLDFFIGSPAENEKRVARIVQPNFNEFLVALTTYPIFGYTMLKLYWPNELFSRAAKNPDWLNPDENGHDRFNDAEWHSLEVGGANGIGTARDLAKLMCLFASGKLVSEKTLELIKNPLLISSTDQVLNIPMTVGHGFEYSVFEDGNYLIGHAGYGGQNAKFDLKRSLCFAYLRNGLSHLASDMSWSYQSLRDSLYEALKTGMTKGTQGV